VIYADLIFLVNFLTDGVLLLATAWTRKCRIKLWRIAAAAAFGSVYVVLLLFPQWSFLLAFSIKFLVSVLMVLISFGYKGWQALARNVAAFYVTAFVTAGGIYGLYYFFLPPKDVLEAVFTGVYEWTAGYGFIGLCFVFLIWLYMRVFRGSKKQEAAAQQMASVEVEIKGHRLSCIGLVDTGNQLYDPLTKTPVMIAEARLWKDVLPKEWLKRLQTQDAESIVAAMGEEEFAWQDRLRIVPYRGVNRSTQFMLAIRPDKVQLHYGGRDWETGKVLIGFDGGQLSADGSYQAIIHPMLLSD
jgi:stage II sporulation protein GA (sporulation sigma-E factor processing peptidase)